MEKEITEYLKEKYSPRVVILVGSRAVGTETEKSDWDIFLFCEKEYSSGFFEWSSQLLDLTFHDWPKPSDWVLTIPYGPLWPAKVLFDDTNGIFEKILGRTKTTYEIGPLKAYSIGCAERLQKLERWRGKMEKYKNEPEIQFYYAGYIYEFLVRIWFEQQNLWSEPPARALPLIKDKDLEFWKLLSGFGSTKGGEQSEITNKIVEKLYSLNKTN